MRTNLFKSTANLTIVGEIFGQSWNLRQGWQNSSAAAPQTAPRSEFLYTYIMFVDAQISL